MPLETEEEEIDEKRALMVWMMWKKILNENDEIDFVLEEDEVREVLAAVSKQKRQEIPKERLRRGFGKPSKSASTAVTRNSRVEVDELKLRTKSNRCGKVGHWARKCPQKPSQGNKRGGRGNQPWKKNEHLSRTRRERRISAT